MILQIENVARAFYDTVHDGKIWANELDIIKEEFRLCARNAIDHLHQNKDKSLADAFYSVAALKRQIKHFGAA
jgi:hypothetical protein